MNIALIGLGEVGRVLFEDLAAGNTLSAWDTAFGDPDSRAARNASELPVRVATDGVDAVQSADLVISAVTAANDLYAARDASAALATGTWFLDLNSASPTQKQEAAALIDEVGGRYVEAAVLSPIYPKRIGSPMLLGGPHASEFVETARGLGFSGVEFFAPTVGPASATKLCRSVVVKGLEALLMESMLTARKWGVEKPVLDSLSNLLPAADWAELADYMIRRSIEHGERRSEEMVEAAATVRDADVDALMATATARRQAWAADQREALAANDLGALLDAIRAASNVIIDCHGHYTTAPEAHSAWRDAQVAAYDAGEPGSAVSEHLGRGDPGDDREESAAPAHRTRRGHDDLLPARIDDGPPHRRRIGQHRLEQSVQRPHQASSRSLSGYVRRCLPAAAVSRRTDRSLDCRTRALCHRVGLRRLQSQPRPERWVVERRTPDRQVVVPVLREDGRTRRAGDGARFGELQSELPRDRCALHQCRHDGVHAVSAGRSLR